MYVSTTFQAKFNVLFIFYKYRATGQDGNHWEIFFGGFPSNTSAKEEFLKEFPEFKPYSNEGAMQWERSYGNMGMGREECRVPVATVQQIINYLGRNSPNYHVSTATTCEGGRYSTFWTVVC